VKSIFDGGGGGGGGVRRGKSACQSAELMTFVRFCQLEPEKNSWLSQVSIKSWR